MAQWDTAASRCSPITALPADLSVHLDSFGNVQLSGDDLLAEDVGLHLGTSLEIRAASDDAPRQHAIFAETFGKVATGGLVVLIDSDGCLAVSVNGGDAARTLGALTGARAVKARDHLILTPNQGHPSW
jgi:S-adenosylmethionine hydrolase